MAEATRQAILDEEHLRLLVLFQYVRAGTTAVISCIPLIHVTLGIVMIFASSFAPAQPKEVAPALIGWLFVGVGMTIILVGWMFAVLQFLAGRFLSRRKHRTFCMVVACLNCLAIPYGTLVGVMTLIVLGRESVRPLFDQGPAPSSPAAAGAVAR
jgi:hypothetical protein